MPLLNETPILTAIINTIGLPALGVLGVWLTIKHIHNNAENY
jgi:hypothetical protein